VNAAHPTQGVSPRYPGVSPANAIKEPRGPTETGQGNDPVTKGPLQQAAKLLPRPPVHTYEGAAETLGAYSRPRPGEPEFMNGACSSCAPSLLGLRE
jgi:hypothetical protein